MANGDAPLAVDDPVLGRVGGRVAVFMGVAQGAEGVPYCAGSVWLAQHGSDTAVAAHVAWRNGAHQFVNLLIKVWGISLHGAIIAGVW